MQNGGLVRLRIGEAKGDFASFHFQEFKNYSYRGGGTRILMFQIFENTQFHVFERTFFG